VRKCEKANEEKSKIFNEEEMVMKWWKKMKKWP